MADGNRIHDLHANSIAHNPLGILLLIKILKINLYYLKDYLCCYDFYRVGIETTHGESTNAYLAATRPIREEPATKTASPVPPPSDSDSDSN